MFQENRLKCQVVPQNSDLHTDPWRQWYPQKTWRSTKREDVFQEHPRALTPLEASEPVVLTSFPVSVGLDAHVQLLEVDIF